MTTTANTPGTFRMTKELQIAADYGKQYFANGFNKQIVYKVYNGDTLIKTLISTQFDKPMYALVHCLTNVIDVQFSVNPKKKTPFPEKKIVVSVS